MDIIEKKLLEIKRKKKLVLQDNIEQISYKNIGFSDWLAKINDHILFDEHENLIEVDLGREKESVLSYKEPNFDFSIPPKFKNIINFEKNGLFIKFFGESDETLDVKLLISEYSTSGKLLITHYINLNETKHIQMDTVVREVRIAMKIRGFGKLKLKEITINENNFWIDPLFTTFKEGFIYLPSVNWYYPRKSGLVFDKVIDGFYVNSTKNPISIVYNETELKKSKVSTLIKDKSNSFHYIHFNGDKDIDVSVDLYIDYFDENKHLSSVSVPLNDSRTISIPENANTFSMHIKVLGKGFFKVNDLIISGYNYWPSSYISKNENNNTLSDSDYIYNISLNDLKDWDKHDIKLNYNKWNQNFIVNLKGNQTLTIPYTGQPLFEIEKDKVYEIRPQGKFEGSTNVTLGVIVTTLDNIKEVYHLPFNQTKFLRFPEMANKVEFYFKISGKGAFKDLCIYVNANPERVTEEVNLSLDEEDWYPGSPKINMKRREESLLISSELGSANKYISYRENNNSFSLPPSIVILRIKKEHIYEINFRATIDDTLQLIPMIIGYHDNKKIEIQQLKVNSKTIYKPNPEVTTIRIALRIGGVGQCNISSFTIKERAILRSEGVTPVYSNHIEVIETGILPPKPLNKVNMAVIFDEFTESSFKYECNIIKFSPHNWREILTSQRPDLLMVESAWRGNDGTWEKRVGDYGEENNRPLFELIEWCNENNIPTVFWNKEDPVHFERFINTAKKFDYVLTTDEKVIPKYIERLGHNRVDALPFAAQPAIHNPIKLYKERIRKANFAGSYYSHHEERSKDMQTLLDAASEYGLDIYDRNHEKTSKGLMPNHTFPERFNPFIKGSLKYYEIDKAYKGYKVSLNVNTVKYSKTMFSRRVFESLACGTPVVSNYSEGIKELFKDLVIASDNKEELRNGLKTLLEDDEKYRLIAHLGIREVLDKHTYSMRLKNILERLNIPFIDQTPDITIVAHAKDNKEADYIIEQYEKQIYKNKKLFLLVETFDNYLDYFNKYNDTEIKVFIREYVINKYPNISEWVNSEFVTFFSSKDYYGSFYLHDLINATKYTDADFIGKKAYYENNNGQLVINEQERNYEFVQTLEPACTIVKTKVFNRQSIKDVYHKFINNEPYKEFFQLGSKLFSVDNFNYIKNGRNTINHNLDYIEI